MESPHGKLPVPNNQNYNIDPNTHDEEFFQEDGLEVDNESGADEDAGDKVQNVKDLELLQRLHLSNDDDDDIPLSEHRDDYIDMHDSDDETYDPANPDHDDYF